MFSWKKNAQEVDKTLKPESEKFKAAGDDGGIKINPSPNTVGTNVQQHIEKIDIPISEAQKIPASEVIHQSPVSSSCTSRNRIACLAKSCSCFKGR